MIPDIALPSKFNAPLCHLEVQHHVYPCTFGKNGLTSEKKEGDGATPIGSFHVRSIYYRADRIDKTQLNTSLPLHPITPWDGWCDDVDSKFYNKPIKLPFKGSYENLWQSDHVYDVIVVIGYNDQPVQAKKGSAIFLHIAHDHFEPTKGCIALRQRDLLTILPYLTPKSIVTITTHGVKITSLE